MLRQQQIITAQNLFPASKYDSTGFVYPAAGFLSNFGLLVLCGGRQLDAISSKCHYYSMEDDTQVKILLFSPNACHGLFFTLSKECKSCSSSSTVAAAVATAVAASAAVVAVLMGTSSKYMIIVLSPTHNFLLGEIPRLLVSLKPSFSLMTSFCGGILASFLTYSIVPFKVTSALKTRFLEGILCPPHAKNLFFGAHRSLNRLFLFYRLTGTARCPCPKPAPTLPQ